MEEEEEARWRTAGAGIKMGSGCAPGLPNPAKETGQIRRLFAHRFVHVRPPLPSSLPESCANPNRFYRAPSPEADPENGRVPSTYPRSATDSSLLLVSGTLVEMLVRRFVTVHIDVLIDTIRGNCTGILISVEEVFWQYRLIGGKNLMFR